MSNHENTMNTADNLNPLTSDEQKQIAAMSSLEKELFADYLLDNYSGGRNYYEGWTRIEFAEAMFAGANAWRNAYKSATRRRSEKP